MQATPQAMKQICAKLIEAAKEPGFFATAVRAVGGISVRQAKQWLHDGRELVASGREPANEREQTLKWFASEIDKADANVEMQAVAKVLQKGNAEWYLERKYSKRWGQKINVTVREELNAFILRIKERVSPDVFEQILEAALAGADDESSGASEGRED